MPKGISIHVGINQVDPTLFFNAPPLHGCENDAKEMCEIAKSKGFQALPPLLGSAATFNAVQTAIVSAAEELQEGDIFLFTFAGHGSRRSDIDLDEADFQDEAVLLFDRLLVDDFLRRALWSRFRSGVRIVGVADCCHSGSALMASLTADMAETASLRPHAKPAAAALATDFELSASARRTVLKGAENFSQAGLSKQPFSRYNTRGMKPTGFPLMREIPTDVRQTHVGNLTGFYKGLKTSMPTGDAAKLKARLLTLAACQDSEKTPDGNPNGVFTRALLDVLNSSNPPASYDALRTEIKKKLDLAGQTQNPVLTPADPAQSFSGQLPFSI